MKDADKIEKKELILVFILVIFSFIYRLFFLYMPLDRDEGTYAYVAQRIYEGELPYKDIFDHKQPFIYYIYKTAFDIFGKIAESIRYFTTFYFLILNLFFYSLIRLLFNFQISLLTLFIFILHQNNHTLQGLNSNTEIFTLLPLIISHIFLINKEKNYENVNLFLTGFFMGVAFFVKTMIGFLIFMPIFYILKFFHKKNKIKFIIWFLFGFLLMLILGILWTFKNGIFNDFVRCNIIYNFNYIKDSNMDFSSIFKGGIYFIKTNLILFFALLYGIYKLFTDTKDEVIFIMVLSVILLYGGIVVLKGIYPHYYIVIIPFLSVLFAILINDFYLKLKEMFNNKVVISLIPLFFIIIYFFYFIIINKVVSYVKSGYYTMAIFYEAKIIGEVINSQKAKGDRVFVYANEPEIYFYTKTKAPGRFIYNYAEKFEKNEFLKMLEKVNKEMPEFFVKEKDNIKYFESILNENYRKIIELNSLVLLKRR